MYLDGQPARSTNAAQRRCQLKTFLGLMIRSRGELQLGTRERKKGMFLTKVRLGLIC